MSAAKKPTGYILYQGPSAIDNSPIVCIAILKSANGKTGNMIQTHIIRSDMSPIAAASVGLDVSICGNCKHRGLPPGERKKRLAVIQRIADRITRKKRLAELAESIGRSCYVNLGQGPKIVYDGYLRGIYPKLSPASQKWAELTAGRAVRCGSYGDPAAIPYAGNFWRLVVRNAIGHTGYSHQWDNQLGKDLRGIVMASVDTPEEKRKAELEGWRTFRTRLKGQKLEDGEMDCLASEEMGYRKQCDDCRLCCGSEKNGHRFSAKSISIPVHGGTAVLSNAKRRLVQLGNMVTV